MTRIAQMDLSQDPPVVLWLINYNEGDTPAPHMVPPEFEDVTDVRPPVEAGYTYDGETWTPGAPQAHQAKRQQTLDTAVGHTVGNDKYLALKTPTAHQTETQVQRLTTQMNLLLNEAIVAAPLPPSPPPQVSAGPVEPPPEEPPLVDPGYGIPEEPLPEEPPPVEEPPVEEPPELPPVEEPPVAPPVDHPPPDLSTGPPISTEPAVPTLDSITPSTGKKNDEVVLLGAGLTGCTAVQFGGAPAIDFEVKDAKTINATVPTGTGVVDVTAQCPAGTATLRDGFTFTK